MRNLGIEITKLIGDIHPTAFTGDMKALAQATAHASDALGGLFALLRLQAPNEATAQAAVQLMVERALRFADGAQARADTLKAHAAPAYHEAHAGRAALAEDGRDG